MKHIDFDFEGRTYALSCTADALFTIYDKYGVTDDILAATHALEPTVEGWVACCWLAALFAAQGELQRRHMGYDPQPMVTLEQLRTGFMAAESVRLREAVKACLAQGFAREVPADPAAGEAEEVNLVLQERDAAQKKTKAAIEAALSTLRSALSGSTSRPGTPSS